MAASPRIQPTASSRLRLMRQPFVCQANLVLLVQVSIGQRLTTHPCRVSQRWRRSQV